MQCLPAQSKRRTILSVAGMSWRRRATTLFALAAFGIGSLSAASGQSDQLAEQPDGNNAQVQVVEGISLPYRSVTISSPVQEILAEVMAGEGDTVEEGQVLAQLYDEKEKIEFRRYEKLLEKREFDNQASRNLLDKNLLSKEKALAAEAELELAQVDYDLARTKLEEKTIRSTVDGIIILRRAEPGESVDRVQALFEVVNIDKLFLQFFVEPILITHLSKGDTIPFETLDPPVRKGEAVVDFISPSADPQSGLFRVKLLADNPGHKFLAGIRVAAQFPASAGE